MIITEAGPADCAALAATSKLAFDADILVGGPAGGPPGYDSPDWHRIMLGEARVFTLAVDGEIAGGAIVFPSSPEAAYLGRIWLVPALQNRGLGKEAMRLVEGSFPGVRRWRLGTPTWNLRNQHFYQRCGYRVAGAEGSDGVLFEKLIGQDAPAAP